VNTRVLPALTLGAVLLLAGCGGGGTETPAAGQNSGAATVQQSGGSAPSLTPKDGVVPTSDPPAPKPKASQVTHLVGIWKGSSPAKDYFEFKADGSGRLNSKGVDLWKGTVIPAGKDTSGNEVFRLSWEGTDPGATYFQVKLTEKGTKLVFEGNSLTYAKVVKKTATQKPTVAPTKKATA
jgi:hypothetical protein